MDQADLLWREASGKPERPSTPAKKSRRTQSRTPDRVKQPEAAELPSLLAGSWFRLGEERGFRFPYNENYLALAIQRKVDADEDLQRYLESGRDDEVNRWLHKMVERWWAEYADEVVTESNAKEYFLDRDWSDLKYYARSCLRAAYLKKHGKPVPEPEYPNQQAYRQRLKQIHQQAQVEQVAEVEESELTGQLDPEARGRLRSFREKRSKK